MSFPRCEGLKCVIPSFFSCVSSTLKPLYARGQIVPVCFMMITTTTTTTAATTLMMMFFLLMMTIIEHRASGDNLVRNILIKTNKYRELGGESLFTLVRTHGRGNQTETGQQQKHTHTLAKNDSKKSLKQAKQSRERTAQPLPDMLCFLRPGGAGGEGEKGQQQNPAL